MKYNQADLIYRRQFILAPRKINLKGNFIILSVSEDYYLYIQKDLAYTTLEKNNYLLVLLGYAVSFEDDYDEEKLMEQISADNIEDLIQNINKYCGRFIIILIKDGNLFLFNDPATLRKVFWIESDQKIWCSSQPHILAELLSIGKTTSPDALEFYNSRAFSESDSIGVSEKTIYKDIYQLLPNHYLNFNIKSTTRFWPYKKLSSIGVSEAVKKSGTIIRGYLENLGKRYQLMLPITAGMDSRVILSASRNISDKVFYYINAEKDQDKNKNDYIISSKLLNRLNLKYHILEIQEDIDPEFEKIYRLNNSYYFKGRLPVIYNYFRYYENYINVPGSFSEVARNAFRFDTDKIDGKKLCRAYYGKEFPYVIKAYDKWIANSANSFLLNNVRLIDMFYWEERMTNWGTIYQMNKDIAQEEFWPFNSRYLMEILLGTDHKCRDEHLGILHKEIIKDLWPETLTMTINPHLKNSIAMILKRLRLYNLLLRLSLIKRF